jgi:hypothetical protein
MPAGGLICCTRRTGSAADGHNWPALPAEHPRMGYWGCQWARKGARCGGGAAVDRFARWLCDFDHWLITDGCEGRGASAFENKRLPAGAEDLPPKPEIMPADQLLKLKKELTAARERQATPANAKGGAAPAKPPRLSSRPIRRFGSEGAALRCRAQSKATNRRDSPSPACLDRPARVAKCRSPPGAGYVAGLRRGRSTPRVA